MGRYENTEINTECRRARSGIHDGNITDNKTGDIVHTRTKARGYTRYINKTCYDLPLKKDLIPNRDF